MSKLLDDLKKFEETFDAEFIKPDSNDMFVFKITPNGLKGLAEILKKEKGFFEQLKEKSEYVSYLMKRITLLAEKGELYIISDFLLKKVIKQ